MYFSIFSFKYYSHLIENKNALLENNTLVIPFCLNLSIAWFLCSLSRERPPLCFAASFDKDKQLTVDYFTCRTCSNVNC